VFVELFLYNFIGQGQDRPPKTLSEYLRNTATLFVSGDVLWAVVQTLYYNLRIDKPIYEVTPGGYFYYPPGHDAKGSFDGYAAGIWTHHASRATGMKLHQPAFDTVNELIELARNANVELVFILTPNHAYDDYYIDAVGEWDTVAEWLTRVSEHAMVYSFSQPNAWVDEPVTRSMRYWNDPYHFSLEMGGAMQRALAGLGDGNTPNDFMVHMTPDAVPAHIESRRQAVRRWSEDNPGFVARFEEERRKWEASRKPAVSRNR
jgi:hypothetical protein